VFTDLAGYFELKEVDEQAVLLITGINIESREVLVNGNGDLLTIVVKIRATPMDELQVIAYGTTSKRFNVGAVTTVKSEDIQKQPVTNVLLTLQGRVPGLIITPSNGAPGATVKLQIRGQNNLASAFTGLQPYDQPLIIIDGVPFASQNLSVNQITSMGGGSNVNASFPGFGALNNINPNNIESISVLRDADATSIYGSQGANGVVLITTKKGVVGKTSFSTRINTGPNRVTRRQKFLDTKQYLALRREAIANDGVTLPPTFDGNFPDLQLFDTTKYTDWFNTFFGGGSNNTDIFSTFTGGTENMSFILSAGYNRSTYNFPGDFANKMLSLHTGFQFRSKNNKLTIDFTTDYSWSHNNTGASPSASSVNSLVPNSPDLLDENGNLVWNYKGFDLSYTFTPTGLYFFQHYAYLKQPYKLNIYNLNNSLQLTYKLFPGLTATANFGYSKVNTAETSQFPQASRSPADPYRMGSATFANNEFETINIEPQLTYQRNIGRGLFSLIAGATYKANGNRNDRITGVDYVNDGFLGSITGAGTVVDAAGYDIKYKYVGVYGRAGYIYDNKYILNIAGRRDGSSNFGPGKQFGTFGSAGVGWIVSEEAFFKKLKPVFSLTKLSASYGTNGSDGVEPYNYQDYWSSPTNTTLFQGIRPYYPLNLYNPDYSWALKKTLNLMLELGLFNDRVLLNATWYQSRTSNQLVNALLPSQTGFNSVTDNLQATVENSGWEFSVYSNNVKSEDFSWTSNFNISTNRNILVAFPDLDISPYAAYYEIGQSLNIVRLFSYKGVNETTGLFEFYDAKGNATYSLNYGLPRYGGDAVNVLNLQPKFSGGLENTFSYKGISLSVFFQFSKQTTYNFLYGIYSSYANMPGMYGNLPAVVLDHWRKPGDQTRLQRATAGYSGEAPNAANYFVQSTGAYSDLSYLRLKTLSLSYRFPSALVKKAGMESLQVYLNAQNLLTITGYEFGDPEQPGELSSIPLQRIIAFGLSFNF
jgi:TonB-dependent starch-binding outer membrane protein SusC